jgi:Rv2525c-like, glycoside hydrolase-like domain
MPGADVQIVDISSGPYDQDTCSTPKKAFLKNLADHGVNTIIRYYSDKNNTPCKNVTKEERALLHDHGFNLAIVYQYMGRTPGRYTKETGAKDGKFCIGRADEIKQPDGSAIYFGIDADTAIHNPEGVLQYFEQVNKAFKGRFKIGCYGAGTVCDQVLAKGLVAFTWVPEAPAWNGTRAFMNSGKWTFYQNKTDMTKSGLSKGHGIEVDTDIVNPKFDSVGAFDRQGTLIKYEKASVQAVADARRWVNRLSMPLFDKPGGTRIGHMCIARMVRVLAPAAESGWVSIDIDEDGQPNGFCEAKHLATLSNMPEWVSGCQPMPL